MKYYNSKIFQLFMVFHTIQVLSHRCWFHLLYPPHPLLPCDTAEKDQLILDTSFSVRRMRTCTSFLLSQKKISTGSYAHVRGILNYSSKSQNNLNWRLCECVSILIRVLMSIFWSKVIGQARSARCQSKGRDPWAIWT